MNLTETLKKIKKASRDFALAEDVEINKILLKLAGELEKNSANILAANELDLKKIALDNPIYDRVLLSDVRIKAIADSVREIAGYDSPIGKIIEERMLKNDLQLSKISTPIGVVGAIFEARPNVVVDIFALCFKSKNACVLKGGSDSANSNEILIEIIKNALGNLDNVVTLLPNDREVVEEFLKADKYIDVIVPRGGQGLIDFVRKTATVPVIETGAGVVHTYVDESADLGKAVKIVFNAKTSRPSVCNALDTLIIHHSRIEDLKEICAPLFKSGVEIYADPSSYEFLNENFAGEKFHKAKEENFGTEYLSLKMSIKTVASLAEAIDHINTYGSGHSEAIITENQTNAEKFLAAVDAACVYVNASTRFTDGGVFGLGAEVGISTQKLHARGPMGIKEMTSYKWQIRGNGQTR